MLLDKGPSPRNHAASAAWIRQQALDRGCKARGISVANQLARTGLGHELTAAAVVGDHRRCAAEQTLEGDQPEDLVRRGVDQQVGVSQRSQALGAGQEPDKAKPIPKAQLLPLPLEGSPDAHVVARNHED